MRTIAAEYLIARAAFVGGFIMGFLAIWQQSVVAAILAGSLVVGAAIIGK